MDTHRSNIYLNNSSKPKGFTVENIPSLKTKLNDQFKLVMGIRNERVLYRKVKNLMSMMLSPVYRYTCVHPSHYKIINSVKMQAVYGMHMAVKIQELADVYNQEKQSEFVKDFLALCMEYFNLTQSTTKKEKIKIHNRINKIIDKIHNFKISHEQWSAQITIVALQNHAISSLTEAFIRSMQ